MNSLGERIRYIREKILNKETQVKFLERLGFNNPNDATVSQWENNRRIPNIHILSKIAELGNVTLDWLINGDKIEELKIYRTVAEKKYTYKTSTKTIADQLHIMLEEINAMPKNQDREVAYYQFIGLVVSMIKDLDTALDELKHSTLLQPYLHESLETTSKLLKDKYVVHKSIGN